MVRSFEIGGEEEHRIISISAKNRTSLTSNFDAAYSIDYSAAEKNVLRSSAAINTNSF